MAEQRLHPSPSHVPRSRGAQREPWHRRHATGITVTLFFAAVVGLSLAPVPERVRPVKLGSLDDAEQLASRVLKKPRMTLAKLEAVAAASDEGNDDGSAEGSDDGAIDEEPEAKDAVASLDPLKAALATTATTTPERAALDDESAPLPARARDRDAAKPSKKVLGWRSLASKLGAKELPVENPCVRFDASGCVRTALDPFFASLDAVDREEEGSHATVVTLGNSLIASDHVTDVVRARLAHRFGSGGRGFLLPERLSKVGGRRARTGTGTDGWEIHTFAQKPPARAEFGFSGSMHESTTGADRISWRLAGATRARLFYLEHEGNPGFVLEADNKTVLDVAPERPAVPQDRVLDVDLERGAKQLRLTAKGKGAVLYGVALAKDAPGVVWDTIGVPASDASMYVNTDDAIFTRQLKAREPSLVVVMIGGNEIRSLAFGWMTLEQVRADYAALLDRVKAAVPDAACLAVAPIDAAKATAAGAELTTRPEVKDVVALEREVALEKGCAFYNLFEAMGGDGSLERFHRQDLINDDLVHPKGDGGDVLGNMLADALLESYRATPLPREEVRARRRIVRPPLYGLSFPRAPGAASGDDEGLARFFRALSAIERGRVAPVRVGLFGGSHVALQTFPSRVRARLTDRFGDAGRGLVAVGGPSERLLSTGVVRRLSGKHEVHDGRDITFGGGMSLFGENVRVFPGGRFEVRFCEGCTESRLSPRGSLELTWLYTPDMGVADVFVNDVQVGALSPASRRTESDVQRLVIPVRGQQHALTVQVRPADENGFEGPVNLFTVAADLRKRGVVVDAVGIPGTTGMTMQRWRQDLLMEQASARRYDLVALAWGANEAGLARLDEATYRYHLDATVDTLLEASPDASCLLLGASDRVIAKGDGRTPAPAHELVERVQREVAAGRGCAFFSTRTAMGGPGSYERWRAEGLATADGLHLTTAGYERLADLLLHDVLALYAYELARAEQEELERAALEVAKGGAVKPAGPKPAALGSGRSG